MWHREHHRNGLQASANTGSGLTLDYSAHLNADLYMHIARKLAGVFPSCGKAVPEAVDGAFLLLSEYFIREHTKYAEFMQCVHTKQEHTVQSWVG